MLYILLSLVLLFPVIIGIGHIASRYISSWKGLSTDFVLGIVGISVIWTIISFFHPLNIFIEAVTIGVGLISFVFSKKYKETWLLLREHYKFFIPTTVIILFIGSFYPFIMDHFGYYIPTIKWLSEIGIVKGISNLDLLLGQMSVWHIFQAGFSNISDPFLRINTILLIGYLVYIIDKKNYLHLLFFPILLLFAQSPSTDLPVIVLAMILLNEILEKSENINGLFIISIFIFIIKPTMIWAPILVFLYGILVLKAKLKWIIPGGILILLFIFKNLWTFGYPIFPISIIDFNLPWKPNAELLSTSSKTAIEKTYDLQYTYQQIQNFSTLEYIKNWFLLKGLKSVIHIGFIISLIGFSIYTFIKKDRIITIICISLFIKSILVLLFSAQYRFFLDVFFAITFVVFYHQIKTSIILSISLIGSIMVSVGLSFPTMIKQMVPSFKLGQFMMGFNKNQLIKPSYFELKNYKTYQVGNLKFNIVDGYIFSFDTPLPAISPQFIQEDLDAGIFPQQISQDIKDGFVWKKITPKQKENIENILKDWQQNMQNRQ